MYYNYFEEEKKEKGKKKESLEEQIVKIKILVDRFLTPEARQRLKFVEMAHPEKAIRAYLFLFQLIQSGQLKRKIDEKTLKNILYKIAEQTTPKYRIKFK